MKPRLKFTMDTQLPDRSELDSLVVRVDLSQGELGETCRQHFRYPISCTESVYRMMESIETETRGDYTVNDVLRDILMVARYEMHQRHKKNMGIEQVYFNICLPGITKPNDMFDAPAATARMKITYNAENNNGPSLTLLMADE